MSWIPASPKMGLEGHAYVLRCESGLYNYFKCSVSLWTHLCWNLGASCAVSSTLHILVSLGKEAHNPCLFIVAGKSHLPEERLGLLDLPCVVSRCDDVPKEVGIPCMQSSNVTLDSCFLPQSCRWQYLTKHMVLLWLGDRLWKQMSLQSILGQQ